MAYSHKFSAVSMVNCRDTMVELYSRIPCFDIVFALAGITQCTTNPVFWRTIHGTLFNRTQHNDTLNIYYTGMFPVGDTSCRTLIDVCVCVCVCVCQSVRRHIAKLRQE